LSEEAHPETFAKPGLDNLESVIPSQKNRCTKIQDGLGEEEEEIEDTHN
jgi:hypothetical protein